MARCKFWSCGVSHRSASGGQREGYRVRVGQQGFSPSFAYLSLYVAYKFLTRAAPAVGSL